MTIAIFLATGLFITAVEVRRLRSLRGADRTAETVDARVWARAWLSVGLLSVGIGLVAIVWG